MAVEVRVPKEITEYREKIIFGLSIRQLLCTLVAIIIAIPSYIFLSKYLGSEITGYVVMILVIPVLAIGFIRPKGLNFEKIAVKAIDHTTSNNKKKYLTITQVELLEEIKNDIEEKQKFFRKRDKNKEEREFKGFEPKEERRKENIKNIKKQIKRAKQDIRRNKKSR
ncbi:MAG: PrgI family protein [Veillonella sp.]|uniref:PrgI family protein n=1 Tax=Veillonella sp. TaxID=1926307 RepID=UPI0028FF50E3|nr:PrgI family protein [Veillonella sp.]MDU2702517.1 PrgI family protein [Veillonella sp.]